MSHITTHVLDLARGRPAAGVRVTLELRSDGGDWQQLGAGETDGDGRLKSLLPPNAALAPGTYRLTFETAAYFAAHGVEGFYPQVSVVFEVRDAAQHYHVPVLLGPYGYTTYRGS